MARLASSLALLALAGCAGGISASPPAVVAQPLDLEARWPLRAQAATAASKPHLYAIDENAVDKYVLDDAKPVRTFTGFTLPAHLAFDRSGHLFVLNGRRSADANSIDELDPVDGTKIRTIRKGLFNPDEMWIDDGDIVLFNIGSASGPGGSATVIAASTGVVEREYGILQDDWDAIEDRAGRLIVEGGYFNLDIFAPNDTSQGKEIEIETSTNPFALATDDENVVYVGGGDGSIVEYAPPAYRIVRSFNLDLGEVRSIAFDSRQTMYAEAYRTQSFAPKATSASIAVIAHGQTLPSRILRFKPPNLPTSMALDPQGDLYVVVGGWVEDGSGNSPRCKKPCQLWKYRAGSTQPVVVSPAFGNGPIAIYPGG